MTIKYSKLDLGRIEAVVNNLGGMDGIDRFLAHELVLVDPTKAKNGAKAPEPLFAFVATFKTEGTKEFVAKKNYVVDTSETALVRISYLGGNFKTHLLPKVERDIAACDLKIQKLRRPSIDLPKNPEEPGTIAGLGGLEKAETSLYEFFKTLAYKQSIGDLSWLVGFVRDADDSNVLWAVSARWSGGGWGLGAYSGSRPREWGAGDEFVSR